VRRLLVHPADALPSAIITVGVALALVPFALRLPGAAVAALLVLSVAARAIAPVHQHCQAHRKLFRNAIFNHFYDFILMLAAGNITAVWELQHVLGHHRSYLNPREDPAGVCRFTGAGPFQRVIFTVAGDLLSCSDSIRIARRQRHARRLLARLLVQQALQLVTLVALLRADAPLALLFFVAPAVLLRWSVFYFSYAQHAEVPGDDVYSGSVTRFGWTNAVFLNVGHHTAHHERPGLHWSLLPARTARIVTRIPPSCLRGAA
jgi:fatty acid desaturase